MTSGATTKEVRLAFNWPKSRVQECLDNGLKHEIVRFLEERHRERFFTPIHALRQTHTGKAGYGFAIMALCSLLIETIECYRLGLPSSSSSDLGSLKPSAENIPAPPEYKLDGLTFPGSGEIFKQFFAEKQHQSFFPGVDGEIFFKNIRCGLLHQAQTKNGWRIARTGKFWDPDPAKQVNRDEFSERLEGCFNAYLEELEEEPDLSSDIWKAARRKIWWLIQIS